MNKHLTVSKLIVVMAVAAVFAGSVTAQQSPPEPPDTKSPVSVPTKIKVQAPVVVTTFPQTRTEKSLQVAAKPTVSMCVASGNVRVNGWDRDEIRVLIDGGTVNFKIAERDQKSEQPTWIFVVGNDPKVKTTVRTDECLAGELIELDVPRESAVNIKGNSENTTVESVGKVKIENIDGNIVVRNVSGGVAINTFEGAVIVERSKGSIMLGSSSGAIVAVSVGQSETGDVFKVKSQGGSIAVQDVAYRQVEINSISGAVTYRGALSNGGQYIFGTQSGRLVMILPRTANCAVTTWSGVGAFSTDFKFRNAVKTGPGMTGAIGETDSDCTLTVKTTSGQIKIVGDSKP